MTRTLIVSLQGLGNALLALPLASALARRDGEPVAMLVRSPRVAALLREQSDIAVAYAANGRRFAGVAGMLRLRHEVRRARFESAVFTFPSGTRSVLFALAAFIPRRIGVAHPEFGWGERLLTSRGRYRHGAHDLEQNAEIARVLGLDTDIDAAWPPLNPLMGQVEHAARFLNDNGFDDKARYVAMHPGSDEDFVEKRWPEAHFAALAESIYERDGRATIVFDGPNERGAGKRLSMLCRTPILAMDGWGDLNDALGMLAFCDLMIANDSGIMNLAAAAGVPTVAIYGPSRADRSKPWRNGAAVIAERACVPCYGLGSWPGCIHPERPCLHDVVPERVLAAALAIGV
ncbi:glycosyltransferase family 9 protein [bacterium]|nr:glycosyltransferase family 9 protein [bacterium]